jgi:hypothetical protein
LPVLLNLDGHTSHKSLKAINMCPDNGIFMVTLPPHTSNRLQPLDFAVYGRFKTSIPRDGQVHDKPSRVTHHRLHARTNN